MTPRDIAIQAAGRSSLVRYGTGAVLVSRSGEIIANGWSHVGAHDLVRYRTVHAELHALMRRRRTSLAGAICVIATRVQGSGRMTTALPCQECARLLRSHGVERVECTNGHGEWERVDLSENPILKDYSPARERIQAAGVAPED